MIANYHTHTWRCGHAVGDVREYVEQAIAAGMQILGFADHTPYPYANGYLSHIRMELGQAEDYFRTVSDLKQEYAGEITLHIGVEAEYYPAYFSDLLQFLGDFPCEYMIMGQHFLHNEWDGVYSGSRTAEERVLIQYVSQVLEGLATGKFSYLAHPDLLQWVGEPAPYRREMTRLCRGVQELGLPLELNLLGLEERRHYPAARFWEIAGEVGNAVVLGCDAHEPEALNRPSVEAAGRELAAGYGLQVLDTVALRPVGC